MHVVPPLGRNDLIIETFRLKAGLRTQIPRAWRQSLGICLTAAITEAMTERLTQLRVEFAAELAAVNTEADANALRDRWSGR